MVKRKNGKNKKSKIAQRSVGVNRSPSRFGAVSAINTAPVSIGNTIRGAQPRVIQTPNGCRVIGRDFAFEAKATVAAATGWSLIGGLPITPSVLPATSLKNYSSMYQYFNVERLAAHYVTSSATSQTGDIMFYYEPDRQSAMIDSSNNSFLPLVLSDPRTVIGPQWTNHTISVNPTKKWRTTNYGTNPDINEEAAGTLYLFSKTSAANSPGYIIIDYDISFRNLVVNPRAGLLPISRGLYNYVCFGPTSDALAVTAGSTAVTLLVTGNNPDGTATAVPNGCVAGDIYKCTALVTNSTVSGVNAAWTNVTAANLFDYNTPGTDQAYTIDDGFTFYAIVSGTGSTLNWNMYPTLTSAIAGGTNTQMSYGVTASITYRLCCIVSFVQSMNSQTQATY